MTRTPWPLTLAVLALVAVPSTARGQRALTDIPVPDVVAEQAAFEVAEGYEIALWAAEPLVRKPLQINFDPQGRLWVASSTVYPQVRPGEIPDDTVSILEDRDADGVADAATVFASGLHMPTAVLPGDGGAYVANSIELLHLADTDADRRAIGSSISRPGLKTPSVTILDPRSQNVVQAVREATQGEGVDMAIDAVGATITRRECIESVAWGGKVVFTGLHDEESNVQANYIIRSEIAVQGSFAYTTLDFEDALNWLADGRITIEPWLQRSPLDEGGACFEPNARRPPSSPPGSAGWQAARPPAKSGSTGGSPHP